MSDMSRPSVATTAKSAADLLRTRAIDVLGLLDREAEREFVVLTEIAKRTFGVSIAMYSLIDAHRHWVKASCGLSVSSLPIEDSFCAHVLARDEILVAEDLEAHPVFRDSAFVTGEPHVRFYAGVPLHARAGVVGRDPVAIGTLCLLDHAPRRFGPEDRALLQDLAGIAEAVIEARAAAVRAELVAEERRHGLKQLQREQRQFRQAERMGHMGSWRVSAEHGLAHWSEGVYAIHELPPGEMPSIEAALAYYPPADRLLVEAAVRRTMATGEPFEIEVDFRTARNNLRRVRILGEAEAETDGTSGIIGVFRDVTEEHRMEQSLRRIASIDDLTQLPNRAECNRVLDRAMASARASGRDLALLLIDLDGFKAVNDRCGHLVGDELLREVGALLCAPYLGRCFAARLGGDEFVLLVSVTDDCRGLDAIVERLLADLRRTVVYGAQTLGVSGTIGIAWLDETVGDRSELMRRADVALYAAKESRRGTARTFEPRRSSGKARNAG